MRSAQAKIKLDSSLPFWFILTLKRLDDAPTHCINEDRFSSLPLLMKCSYPLETASLFRCHVLPDTWCPSYFPIALTKHDDQSNL